MQMVYALFLLDKNMRVHTFIAEFIVYYLV